MKRVYLIVTFGLIIILNSCSNKNLSNYYFPTNKQSDTKIYKYIDPKNVEPNLYWKVKSDPLKKTLITESYNSNFKLYNSFEERFEKNKTQLISYIDYEGEYNTPQKEIIGVIKENQVFNSDKSKTYSYMVEYENKYGKIRYKKKRKFLKFEQIEIQGKKYKTAKFKDEFIIEAIDLKDKFGFYDISYYAKGIGMIKSVRHAATNEVITFELEKILTEEEFNNIKEKVNR